MTRVPRWAGAALREVLGLVVDDGRLALAIAGWLLACWLVVPRLGAGGAWAGPVLAAGLAAALLGSTLRHAARRR